MSKERNSAGELLEYPVLVHTTRRVISADPGQSVGVVTRNEDGSLEPVRLMGQMLGEGGVFEVHLTIVKLVGSEEEECQLPN